jgi:orotidine-5'-phosphate decarboxylase
MVNRGTRERVILALDTSEEKRVEELLNTLGDRIEIFKVGLEQYLASRGKIVEYLNSLGKKVFLDLKFHDIPNTMAAAARNAVKAGVWMFNVHVTGSEGMKWVRDAVEDEAEKTGVEKPLVIGVTVLTSLGESDLVDLGINLPVREVVLKRARLASEMGLDGVVSSPLEAGLIKEKYGEKFITVCPGIRPSRAVKADQKRVMTPAEAIKNGADYLVIGRPITRADNPAEAAERIQEELEN